MMRFEHLKTLLHAFESVNQHNSDASSKLIEESKSNENLHLQCLKRIAGFFAISLSLHHNLPNLFNEQSLREMYDMTNISLQKGLESAISGSELEEIYTIKQGMLHFSLCIQD
jgi:hypothetical protein